MLSSEWSCPSLKCEGQQCGPVSASCDFAVVSKDDAGSPSCINCEDVLAESTCNLPSTYFKGSLNKPL